eukprot:CAMPEP_0185509716 /NCGR_PEP_ID=MMETSP1366-20130426/47498_1 /TAXON_ID=38817 /ORGANISM="Gephyrocapsa oceanica, Strain RCC1303" /LENGTH=58 /DNA_ID=CAMNT_0028120173 /DNA_START=24 /DNA_END=198 /DNA_ORIENTATION=-
MSSLCDGETNRSRREAEGIEDLPGGEARGRATGQGRKWAQGASQRAAPVRDDAVLDRV